MTNELNTPWTLAWDRDGTEDFGAIYDATGMEIVSSQHCQTCWLPEAGQPIPHLVKQLWLMEAAPKLLSMLKIAIATADPAKHKWVNEAWEVIAEATGHPFDAKETEIARPTHQTAPSLYAALEKAESMLLDYKLLAQARAVYFGVETGHVVAQIEAVRREARAALQEATGQPD